MAVTLTAAPVSHTLRLTPKGATIMAETKASETKPDTTDEVAPEATDEAPASIVEELDARSDEAVVAARSADIHADEAPKGEHVKIFVIPGDEPKPTASNYDHEPNYAAVRQYMLSQGLRPTGDVRFVSSKAYGPGGSSWALKYAVAATPAERFDFAEVHVIQSEDDTKPAE